MGLLHKPPCKLYTHHGPCHLVFRPPNHHIRQCSSQHYRRNRIRNSIIGSQRLFDSTSGLWKETTLTRTAFRSTKWTKPVTILIGDSYSPLRILILQCPMPARVFSSWRMNGGRSTGKTHQWLTSFKMALGFLVRCICIYVPRFTMSHTYFGCLNLQRRPHRIREPFQIS